MMDPGLVALKDGPSPHKLLWQRQCADVCWAECAWSMRKTRNPLGP